MKRTFVAVLLTLIGCIPQTTRLGPELIPADRIHLSSPWSIAGVSIWSPVAFPNLKDSTEIQRSVTLSPGFHLGELAMDISFDTLQIERSSRTLRVSGHISVRQSGETISGVRVLHLHPHKTALPQREGSFKATPLGFSISDAVGRFGGTVVISEGDLIAFVALGFVTSFFSVDPILH